MLKYVMRPASIPNHPVHVLGLAGSPRRNGNTDLLLAEALKGAASKGATTETLFICKLSIEPCRHCDGCLKTGACVIDDDMQTVHRKLREADRVVLASPVFFMGITAQAKAMIDRCQAMWALKYLLKQPVGLSGQPRKGLWLAVGGLPYEKERLFSPSRATVRAWFATLDIKFAGELVYPHIDKKGEISTHPTALKDAFGAGQGLVE